MTNHFMQFSIHDYILYVFQQLHLYDMQNLIYADFDRPITQMLINSPPFKRPHIFQ